MWKTRLRWKKLWGNWQVRARLLLLNSLRREAQALVRFFHPNFCCNRPIVDLHFHNHTASPAHGRIRGAVNFVSVDGAILAARSPILNKLIEGIARILLGMLLPGRVGRPYRVCAFIVLRFDLLEEFVYHAFFRPEAHLPEGKS